MHLEKYRNYKGEIWIRPANKEDVNLFRHWAHGHAAFPNKLFKKEVEPMLLSHGLTCIKITDRSRNKKIKD